MHARCNQRIGRRRFLRDTASALAVGSFVLTGEDIWSAGTAAREDAPNTHNMLVFGTGTVFLSHLPMFDGLDKTKTDFTSPHRYQVILEARFTNEGKDLHEVYAKDRRAHPETRIYTVGPQRFVLTRLFTPEKSPELSSFRATVFRGHLEDGGMPVPGLEKVVVEVARVVHGRKFDPAAKKPQALEYILVGDGTERFVVHAIVAPPDFDQVLAVAVKGAELPERDLSQDIRVSIPDRKNVAADRVREGQRIQATLRVGAATPSKVELEIGREIYFEEGELLVPPTFAPTAEEKKK